MGNDNKIKISKAEVRLFLRPEMLPSDNEPPAIYDLETEYAKTKKGKSHFTLWVMLICTAVVALITFGVTKYIDYRNSNISVGIDVFEDLNLKNLLDVVSRTEESLDIVTSQKIQLETEKKSLVSQAESERDSQLLILDSMRLSNAERNRRKTKVQEDYEASIAEISEQFDSKIDMCNIQIEEYQQQLASYDKKNVELAQQQEAAINSQRQLFELEKQQLSSEYMATISDLQQQLADLRQEMVEVQKESVVALSAQYEKELQALDPVFQDERGEQIVSRFVSNEKTITEDVVENNESVAGTDEISTSSSVETIYPEVFSVDNIQLDLSDSNLMEQAVKALADIDSQFSDFNHVAEMVKETPWNNSLDEYIQTMQHLANKIGSDAVQSSVELLRQQEAQIVELKNQYGSEQQMVANAQQSLVSVQSDLKSANSTIKSIEEENAIYKRMLSAFDAKAYQNGDVGYILDTSTQDKMLAYVAPLYSATLGDGTLAYVFRSSDELIGTVTLFREGKFIYAVPESQDVASKIQANDQILLELIK